MIKVFAMLPKLPLITDEKFHAHWRVPHGELARRITSIRRYSQSHSIASSVSGFPPAPYLGVAEVYFDSLEIAAGMGNDPNYRDYCGADEPNFIDQSRLAFLFCAERVVLTGPDLAIDSPEVKALLLLKRASGLTPGVFRDGLASLSDAAIAATPELSRYVQCTTLPEMYDSGEPAFDAIIELSWPTRAAYERSWSSPQVASKHLPALAAITDLRDSCSLLAEPYRVIWP